MVNAAVNGSFVNQGAVGGDWVINFTGGSITIVGVAGTYNPAADAQIV
ncbi:MAG: hypothetical protein AAF468_21975 [Pseudomonadota bacterium]